MDRSFRGAHLAHSLVVLALAGPVAAVAGTITLQISASAHVEDQTARCIIGVENQGDEPAFDLQPVVLLGQERESSPTLDALQPRERHEFAVPVAVDGLARGRHAVLIRVDYTDANGYPLTAVAHTRLTLGEDTPPEIHAQMGDVELAEAASLEIRVRSSLDKEVPVHVSMVLPRELNCPDSRRDVILAPGTEVGMQFQLENFSAPVGSTYTILANVGYDLDGIHSSLVVPARVVIIPQLSFFNRHWKLLLTALAVLLAVLVAVLVLRGGRRTP